MRTPDEARRTAIRQVSHNQRPSPVHNMADQIAKTYAAAAAQAARQAQAAAAEAARRKK